MSDPSKTPAPALGTWERAHAAADDAAAALTEHGGGTPLAELTAKLENATHNLRTTTIAGDRPTLRQEIAHLLATLHLCADGAGRIATQQAEEAGDGAHG